MLGQMLLWYLTLAVLSLAAYPLAYHAFSRLPDRGWAFSKPLGLLLTGLVTWAIGLSHTAPNSRWTVLAALIAVAVVSWTLHRRSLREPWDFLRAHLNTVLVTDGVFLAVFVAVALLRAAAPDIVHTEQPMDFMFLNAVVTSPHYPPNDPWMAGQTVSYYYLGYLLIGAVSMLTGIATAVAYNLGLATFAAMGAVSAFGLTFNLIRLAKGKPGAAVLGGFGAVFLLLFASNLGGVLELGQAAGAGNASFWQWVGINGLTAQTPSTSWAPDQAGWWWWNISRIIPGAITEFPAFSFILGDMHPHVMSIGFVLMAGGIATQVYLQPGLLRRDALHRHWPLALVAVASVGAAAPLNLWDVPLELGLVGSALLLNAARNERTLGAGSTVALYAGTAAMGAPGDWDGAGAVLVYRKRGSRWRRVADLHADLSDTHTDARLGAAVALQGQTIAAGAPGANAVCIFTAEDGVWSQTALVRPPGSASNGVGAGFGHSVALEENVIAVGAPDAPGGGAVYVYRVRDAAWSFEAGILEEDLPPDARFGHAIALHKDTLAVSAPGEEAVYIFGLSTGSWGRLAKLKASPLTPAEGFGQSIALGLNRLAVGAIGAAFVFRRGDEGWDQGRIVVAPEAGSKMSFGSGVAIQDPYLMVAANSADDSASRSGAVFMFKRDGAAWRLQSRLHADDVQADCYLGSSLSMDGTLVAASAPGNGNGGTYLFNRTVDKWELVHKLVSRWRFARALAAAGLLTLGALLVAAPFLAGFQSGANGVLPLRGLLTRPLYLILVWGAFAVLVLPLFALTLRRVFTKGNWSLMRFGVSAFIGFAPVILWLQPVWGIPFYLTALLLNGTIIFLFGLHQAGYRLPRVDEASLAFSSGTTRVVGIALLISLLLWDGIVHGERGADGQYLALNRLMIVTPVALVLSLAIFAAWTLAYRDSERRRLAPGHPDAHTRNDAHVPAMLMLAFAAALIMGVELFYVSDVFGGDLRRMNTVFKAYYEGWILMSVLAGFGLWAVTSRMHLRGLPARAITVAWGALLAMMVAGLSYYSLAAVSSVTSGGNGLQLNGEAYLQASAPAEYEAIQWIRGNLPRDAIVLESVVVPCSNTAAGCSDYTAAGIISESTGRPTVLGWTGHEIQWRSNANSITTREADVRTIYETTNKAVASGLLAKYGVEYVILGPQEYAAYGTTGAAKFAQMGTPVFTTTGGALTIYKINAGDSSQ